MSMEDQAWAEHPYPEGVKNYNKSKPMQFSEFQPEIDWWGDEADGFKARKETNQAWKRSVEYFEQRGFNFDDKNPFEEAKKDLDGSAEQRRLACEPQTR